MRIELTTDGGFAAIPGLARPLVLDGATLPPELNKQLESLLQAAAAETAPAPPPAMRDGRRYRITVEGDGGRQTLSAADPDIPAGFAALMAFIQSHGRR